LRHVSYQKGRYDLYYTGITTTRGEEIMTRESFINKEQKQNVKTFLRILAIITVICVMMLAGCTKKVEEPVAIQSAVTETQTEVTTEAATQETVLTLEEYIESVHSEYLKNVNKDNKNPGWFLFIWNYTTGTAELTSNDDRIQLKEDEKLVLYIPEGIDSILGGKGVVESTIGYSNYVVFTLNEFSGEQPFSMAIEPKNEQIERFDLRLIVVGNLEEIITETQSFVDREFSEEVSFTNWVVSYVTWDSLGRSDIGLTFLWDGDSEKGYLWDGDRDREKGYAKIITDGDRVHKGENQKIIFSSGDGRYGPNILTPETASIEPFWGLDFEIAVIDSEEEFDVKILVNDQLEKTKTEFTFTIIP